MTNNTIHDCGLSGIQTGKNGEWYWILHNHLYNNSSTSGYMGSGISVYEPTNVSPYTPTAMDNAWSPYHIAVNYNISHDNFNAQGAFGYQKAQADFRIRISIRRRSRTSPWLSQRVSLRRSGSSL